MTQVPLGGQSAITIWAALVSSMAANAQTIFQGLTQAQRVFVANQLDALIRDTPAGEPVGDSQLTPLQASAVHAMFISFMEWAQTPLETDVEGLEGITPEHVLYRQWPRPQAQQARWTNPEETLAPLPKEAAPPPAKRR